MFRSVIKRTSLLLGGAGFAVVLALLLISRPYELRGVQSCDVVLLRTVEVKEGKISQGIVAAGDAFYASQAPGIYRYDLDWKLTKQVPLVFPGIAVPHVGALARDGDDLLAGVIDLAAYADGKANTRIVRYDRDLAVRAIYDLSAVTRYVDALAVADGRVLLSVGDLLYVLRIDEGAPRLERRIRIATGTAQGMVVQGDSLYVVPENQTLDVRGFPQGLYRYPLPPLLRHEETWLAGLAIVMDRALHVINYRYPNRLANRYLSPQVHFPVQVWKFGYPVGKPDNEGFSFDPRDLQTIWVSDVTGRHARHLRLRNPGS